MRKQYYNANYFAADGLFHHGGFCVENGRFQDVGNIDVGNIDDGEDLHNAYVLPGLLDIHTHGNSGYDFSTCSEEELAVIARAHAKAGVAGFCPTSMTLPEDMLAKAFSNAARLKKNPPKGTARILGINMEGPFLAPGRKGAQNAAYLLAPDVALYRRLQDAAQGAICMIDVAPEIPGALAFAGALKEEVILSLAHSDAAYEAAAAGFEAGLSHMTHLFNAMPGLNHRAPGPIAAAAEREGVFVELVADGVHLHPSIIRLCFKLFGAERICLVSDSMEACFMEDGVYALGGQTVNVKGPLATLADGTIAGSATPVYRCMQNILAWGMKKEDAVKAAALTPAKRLGLQAEYGSITDGKRASFVIADEAFHLKRAFIEGEAVAV